MEEVQPSSLFSLSIDPSTKAHLSETARWARFLSIVGMIGLALMVVFGLFYSIWISNVIDGLQTQMGFQARRNYNSGVAAGSALMFIIIAAIGFFPMLFMFRFASEMKIALNANDQEKLNSSFQNLKRYFRYFGVITIIGIGIWTIWLIVIGAAVISLR